MIREHEVNEHIRTYGFHSDENKRLVATAYILNSFDESYEYYTENVYFDYDQNWRWTTIIKIKSKGERYRVQALTPRQQEAILFGDFADFVATIDELLRKGNRK